MTRLLEHLMADADDTDRRTVDEPTDLRFVGPATAAAIAEADFSAQSILDKEVSYRMLREAGVNPGVAAKIRRYHSLSWSFDNDGDLGRRSEQVRGLQDDEAAWVASSGIGEDDATADSAPPDDESDDEAAWVDDATAADAGGGEEADESSADAVDGEAAWVADSTGDASASADGSGDPLAAEAAWRERSKPTPLTEIPGVGESYADRLAEAGVTSVRSLATASPELLSDVTGIAEERLRRWHREASERAD